MAPSVLEGRVREHWLIAECVVVGDRRPYVAALVTLDDGAFARWKRRQAKPAGAKVGDLREDPGLLGVVQEAVDRRTRRCPGRGHQAVPHPARPFEVGAELTPTQKVRRDYVLAKYASEIDALYA